MAKRTNNNLQNTTQKTKDRATRSPLKTVRTREEYVDHSCSTSGTRRITLVTHPVMNEERTGKCLRQVEHIRGHL